MQTLERPLKIFFKEEWVISQQGRWNRIKKHSQLTQEKAGKEKKDKGNKWTHINYKDRLVKSKRTNEEKYAMQTLIKKRKKSWSSYVIKENFKTRDIIRDREVYYITIKGLLFQENVTN